MKEIRGFDVTICKNFKERIEKLINSCSLPNPVAGLLWSSTDDDDRERFSIGLYEKSELPEEDPIYIIESDGTEIVIIQDWILEVLEGKKLDCDETGIVIRLDHGRAKFQDLDPIRPG